MIKGRNICFESIAPLGDRELSLAFLLGSHFITGSGWLTLELHQIE